SHDGSNAPVIYNIGLQYALDTAPQPPIFVTVDSVGNNMVALKWKKNVEYDILGYNIYYGVKSKQYDGIIRTVNGKRISNELSDTNGYITVTLTNDVIEENRANDTKGFLTFPVLKNNVLYFFAVTAYDSYKPDTMFNHESKHSKEVSARPDPGSDIK
ncbi:MAG: fibronectin type III domain-containing protein, partial [Spirochaetes bacterium]|nr:fibronectin type III domain-containing protein [Spirochaetota bacterium]